MFANPLDASITFLPHEYHNQYCPADTSCTTRQLNQNTEYSSCNADAYLRTAMRDDSGKITLLGMVSYVDPTEFCLLGCVT